MREVLSKRVAHACEAGVALPCQLLAVSLDRRTLHQAPTRAGAVGLYG